MLGIKGKKGKRLSEKHGFLQCCDDDGTLLSEGQFDLSLKS